MRILSGYELEETQRWFELCRAEGILARCQRSKCGSVVVEYSDARNINDKNRGYLLGKGNNRPARGSQVRCGVEKSTYHSKVTDKTCCIHAEQNAILNYLSGEKFENPNNFFTRRIYFARLGPDRQIKPSGQPYCTVCSKLALQAEINEWCLIHPSGTTIYTAEEYNELSYSYKG